MRFSTALLTAATLAVHATVSALPQATTGLTVHSLHEAGVQGASDKQAAAITDALSKLDIQKLVQSSGKDPEAVAAQIAGALKEMNIEY
ncbi:MAG: hypothetical protein M1834_009028 [Cirrosporium novae-zelandiae]|nr:MAG: hypothetical protein M1834_009028 [Cirrosporium novae-zelandiae]